MSDNVYKFSEFSLKLVHDLLPLLGFSVFRNIITTEVMENVVCPLSSSTKAIFPSIYIYML